MTYWVRFVDHGGRIYYERETENDSDEEAIKAAHSIHVRSIGAGFEVWQEDRLVHHYRT